MILHNHLRVLSFVTMVTVSAAHAADEPGFFASGITDIQYAYSDSRHSWLDHGPDKLRYDESDQNEFQLGRQGLELGYAFNLQSEIRASVHSYLDPDPSVELTEAYWQYRTLPEGHWRGRYRIGAFYPPISMENGGPLWTSPYTISSSAINTWIAEEIRIIGAEGRWTWSGGPYNRSSHKFSVFASLFGWNDPAGAMISWRGWSVHDRQTGVNGSLPMRALPVVVRINHSPDFEPYMEIDDRPGFYVGGEWSYKRQLRVQLMHYDNQADSTLRQDGQYGWRTDFTQLGAHWRGGNGWELLGQAMTGRTVMMVDRVVNDFESVYIMAVKSRDRHRVALRLEYFRIDDLDDSSIDFNAESGNSQTLSYSYLFGKSWKLTLESTRFYSDYAARMHFGEQPKRKEHTFLTSLRHYF